MMIRALRLLLCGVQLAQAATFEVTRFEDGRDGVCDAHCTLREAVDAANPTVERDGVLLSEGSDTLSNGNDPGAEGSIVIRDELELVGVGRDATCTPIAAEAGSMMYFSIMPLAWHGFREVEL